MMLRALYQIAILKSPFASYNYKTAHKISQICIDRTKNTEFLSWQQIINLSLESQILTRNNMQPLILKKCFYYYDDEMKQKILSC